MILYINTADKEKIKIALRQERTNSGKGVLVTVAQQEFLAARAQSEKLLPAIDKMLKKNKIKLSNLKKIIVSDSGGSFTSLRIGIATANALAYALNIPIEAEDKGSKIKVSQGIKIVKPKYDREPSIGR